MENVVRQYSHSVWYIEVYCNVIEVYGFGIQRYPLFSLHPDRKRRYNPISPKIPYYNRRVKFPVRYMITITSLIPTDGSHILVLHPRRHCFRNKLLVIFDTKNNSDTDIHAVFQPLSRKIGVNVLCIFFKNFTRCVLVEVCDVEKMSSIIVVQWWSYSLFSETHKAMYTIDRWRTRAV